MPGISWAAAFRWSRSGSRCRQWVSRSPSRGASGIEALRELGRTAGLEGVETRGITVQRSFESFEDFWTTSRLSSSMGPAIAAMAASDVEQLEARVRARLPAEAAGRLT